MSTQSYRSRSAPLISRVRMTVYIGASNFCAIMNIYLGLWDEGCSCQLAAADSGRWHAVQCYK